VFIVFDAKGHFINIGVHMTAMGMIDIEFDKTSQAFELEVRTGESGPFIMLGTEGRVTALEVHRATDGGKLPVSEIKGLCGHQRPGQPEQRSQEEETPKANSQGYGTWQGFV